MNLVFAALVWRMFALWLGVFRLPSLFSRYWNRVVLTKLFFSFKFRRFTSGLLAFSRASQGSGDDFSEG